MTVMADQGSDANVLPPQVLSQILSSNPDLNVINLERTAHYETVDKSPPISALQSQGYGKCSTSHTPWNKSIAT